MSWVIAKRNSTPPKFSFDPFGIATACGRTRWIFGRTGRAACTTNSNPRVGHSIGSHLRTCEKIRKRRTRARKAVWQGAREGASPAAGCNRADNAARRPFLLSAPGLRVFLAWPALLGRDSRAKGDSLPKAARRAVQSIGNTAAGIASCPHALAKPKIQQRRGTL